MIKNGVWSTMITPFTDDDKIDYSALEILIEWYIERGVAGLFAVCQSSEMDFLSLNEKIELTKFIVEKVAGRVGVVTSGHSADTILEQINELIEINKAKADAIVLITNKMAKIDESDEIFKENLLKIVNALPKDTKFGLYERPFPYKRLLNSKLLKWIINLDKFVFLKDASCDMKIIKEKLKVMEGSELKLFNANSATLIDSIKAGAHGYCGIMANFHPECYNKAMDFTLEKRETKEIESFITLSSVIEYQNYPRNSKYYLNISGVPMNTNTRSKSNVLSNSQKLELEALSKLSLYYTSLN